MGGVFSRIATTTVAVSMTAGMMVGGLSAVPAQAVGSWTDPAQISADGIDVDQRVVNSRNGKTVAYSGDNGAFVVRFNDSTQTWDNPVLLNEDDDVAETYGIEISADGNTVAWFYAASDYYQLKISRFDGTNWSDPVRVSPEGEDVAYEDPIRISDDGSVLLYLMDDASDLLSSRLEGSSWTPHLVHEAVYDDDAFRLSADGDGVIYGHDDETVDPAETRFWRAEWNGSSWGAGSPVTQLGLNVTDSGISASGDLNRFVYDTWDGDLFVGTLWVTSYVDGAWREPQNICQDQCDAPGENYNYVSISRDGSAATFQTNRLGDDYIFVTEVSDTEAGAPVQVSQRAGDAEYADLSDNGDRVAYHDAINDAPNQAIVLGTRTSDSSWVNQDMSISPSLAGYEPALSGNGLGLAWRSLDGGDTKAWVRLYLPSLPSAPAAPTAVKEGINDAKVSFTVPSETGGPAVSIEEYEVQAFRDGVAGKTCNAMDPKPTEMFCVVKGLDSGKYKFKVRAKNATGWSEWSAFSNELEFKVDSVAKSVLTLAEQVVANVKTPVDIKVTVNDQLVDGEATVHQIVPGAATGAAQASAQKYVCKATITNGNGRCFGKFGLGKIRLVSYFNGADVSDLESNKDSASLAAVSILSSKPAGGKVRLRGQAMTKGMPVWIYRAHKRGTRAKLVAKTKANRLHAWGKGQVRAGALPVYFCAVTPKGPSATIRVTKKSVKVVPKRGSRGDVRFC